MKFVSKVASISLNRLGGAQHWPVLLRHIERSWLRWFGYSEMKDPRADPAPNGVITSPSRSGSTLGSHSMLLKEQHVWASRTDGRSTILWIINESNSYSWTVFAQTHQSKCQLTVYFSPSNVFCILHFSWHSYQEAYSGNNVQTRHPRHNKQSTVNTASVRSTVLKQE